MTIQLRASTKTIQDYMRLRARKKSRVHYHTIADFPTGLLLVGYRKNTRKLTRAPRPIAIQYITQVCGEPPPEMSLELIWQEHDLGNYPAIGLVWDDAMRGTPWNYLSKCEAALMAYDDAEDPRLERVMPPALREDDNPSIPFDPDEPPPEPPDSNKTSEYQRYLSELIGASQLVNGNRVDPAV